MLKVFIDRAGRRGQDYAMARGWHEDAEAHWYNNQIVHGLGTATGVSFSG